MRCAATIRYARRCSRTASWMVDGEPMCGQHRNAMSMTDGYNECVPLTQWDGSCTGALYCPAEVHIEGCYQPYPTRAPR